MKQNLPLDPYKESVARRRLELVDFVSPAAASVLCGVAHKRTGFFNSHT